MGLEHVDESSDGQGNEKADDADPNVESSCLKPRVSNCLWAIIHEYAYHTCILVLVQVPIMCWIFSQWPFYNLVAAPTVVVSSVELVVNESNSQTA